MTELILGLDEAGKGPLIGPMIIAGCLVDKQTEKKLKRLGVKDSKQLTPKRREFLAEKIREQAETFKLSVIPPTEIDSTNKEGINLNQLEAMKMAEVINKINKGLGKIKVIIDCPSVSIEKWQDFLKTKIKNLSNLEISCEHKADQNHASVSSASILAKSERERQMDILKKKYTDQIGSGYCTDPKSIEFLKKYIKKYEHEGIFRKSWDTWKKAIHELGQRKLEI